MKKLAILLVFLGCKEPAGPPVAPPLPAKKAPKGPDWGSAFSHEVTYDGAKKALLVDVQIAPGFHAYTVGESIGKPMKVDLEGPIEHAGPVEYPKGIEKNLPIGKSVIVEGKAQIVAPTKGEGAECKGKFRYQVCTDSACDRPRTVPFAVPTSS